MNVDEFRDDLHHMTLEQALIKHNTDLHTVMHILGYKERASKTNYRNGKPKQKYIQQVDRYFQVKKQINGRMIHFGSYHTLEEAITARDWLVEHNWNKSLFRKEVLGV